MTLGLLLVGGRQFMQNRDYTRRAEGNPYLADEDWWMMRPETAAARYKEGMGKLDDDNYRANRASGRPMVGVPAHWVERAQAEHDYEKSKFDLNALIDERRARGEYVLANDFIPGSSKEQIDRQVADREREAALQLLGWSGDSFLDPNLLENAINRGREDRWNEAAVSSGRNALNTRGEYPGVLVGGSNSATVNNILDYLAATDDPAAGSGGGGAPPLVSQEDLADLIAEVNLGKVVENDTAARLTPYYSRAVGDIGKWDKKNKGFLGFDAQLRTDLESLMISRYFAEQANKGLLDSILSGDPLNAANLYLSDRRKGLRAQAVLDYWRNQGVEVPEFERLQTSPINMQARAMDEALSGDRYPESSFSGNLKALGLTTWKDIAEFAESEDNQRMYPSIVKKAEALLAKRKSAIEQGWSESYLQDYLEAFLRE